MSEEVKHSGVPVTMDGRKWTIPALTLKQLRMLNSDMDRISEMKDSAVRLPDEVMDSMLRVIAAALSRNYPEITAEELSEMIDLNDLPKVMKAVMGVSGLEVRPGE